MSNGQQWPQRRCSCEPTLSPTDAQRWRHALDASDRIAEHVEDGRAAFEADSTRQEAAIYCLLVIGEAVGKLGVRADAVLGPDEVRRAVSMRNLLAHEYWRVDVAVLWQTITEDIPRLAAEIRRHLDD